MALVRAPCFGVVGFPAWLHAKREESSLLDMVTLRMVRVRACTRHGAARDIAYDAPTLWAFEGSIRVGL